METPNIVPILLDLTETPPVFVYIEKVEINKR